MAFDAPVVAPFEIVKDEWIDYNGHLNMAYYNVLFDHGVDHFFALLGCGPDYVEKRGMSCFTAEVHVTYLRELKAGERAWATTLLVENDAKRMRLYQELFHEDGWLSATSESVVLHVDLSGPRVAPFPSDIAEKVETARHAHENAARPARLGQGIALKRRSAD